MDKKNAVDISGLHKNMDCSVTGNFTYNFIPNQLEYENSQMQRKQTVKPQAVIMIAMYKVGRHV